MAPGFAVSRKKPKIMVLLALLFLANLAGAADGKPLVFGVLNQQSPALTAERWNPILHYLGVATGLTFQLRMGRTVQETDAMMGRGEFDLVYTNHNFQREFDGAYKVIARWSGEPIRCVIAVPADSPLRALPSLQGRRVAFPSREAFVGYAVPKVALRTAGVRVEEVFSGNQEGALAQLKARQVEAAAVNSRFLQQYAEREGLQYRELYVSEPFLELPVIAHSRLPRDKVEAIRRALLGMRHDEQASGLLVKLKFSGFEAADDRQYDNVRRTYRLIGE